MVTDLKPGTELYSVSTRRFDPFIRESRDALERMTRLDGLLVVHTDPSDGSLLWLFDSEDHAKAARSIAESEGFLCGHEIDRYVVAADGVPVADGAGRR